MGKKSILFFLILFQSLIAGAQTDTVLTKKKLQGDWKCISIIQDVRMLATDDGADYYSYFPIGNLRIDGNEILFFDYPCEYTSKAKLQKGNFGFFYEEKSEHYTYSYNFKFKNDTLVVEEGFPGGYVREFIRDKMDNVILDKLKKNWLNPDCMQGEWELVRSETGSDGSEHDYPNNINLPDTISYNFKNYQTEGEYLILDINGKPRKFEITWYYNIFFRSMRFDLKMIEGTEEEKSGIIVYRKLDNEE